MTWTTLTLQVTTPLFNGGADPDGSAGLRPDQEAGIRVASIRGSMRFWFRALVGVLTGPDLRLLALH
jgi:CRISPR type III-B/RAMP module RAMP protein Cmr1